MDNIYVIVSAWTRFERCYGTLDQLKLCQEKCKERLELEVPAQISSVPNENSTNNLSIGDRNKGIKRKHFDRGRGRGGGSSSSSAGVNRFAVNRKQNNDNGMPAPKNVPNEQLQWSSKVKAEQQKQKQNQRNDSPPANKRPRLENVAEIHDTQMIDTSKDNVTIFLSNLDYK